jgi:mannose-6-phosphate isomerase-like protein (cupin superfamily)
MPTLALEDYPQSDYQTDQAAACGTPRQYTYAGASINIKATARETNHANSLIELTLPGRFPGAPLHYHKTFVESFYILEGQVRIKRGDENLIATPGTLIHIPMGVVHGFCNATDHPARLLVICTPGGHDKFFTNLLAWLQREPDWPPTNLEALAAFGRDHDTYFV